MLRAASAPPSAIGVKRLLLYRVDFSDFTNAAISSNAATTLIGDLNNFYRDMSYGLMRFALAGEGSVVSETLRLPEPSFAYDNDFRKLISATRQAATAAGLAPGEFDFDIICTGSRPGAFFGGIAFVGGPGVWLANGNFNASVAGHELGHNLGLSHASLWNTGDQSSIGPGTRGEYGDIFDSMGAPLGTTSHFNARYKHLLAWIPEGDAPFITANGTYRITAEDHPSAGGRRALRIRRDDSWNYWVEFRQFFNNRFVTNAATLRWAGNNATNSLLLDATPGTAGLFQDSPLLIGRTFTDSCLDLHITPIGKGGTEPESLDVVVNRGPFPGNIAPVISIAASTTNTTSNTVVTLQATASDANGDALAYYWDYGDGNFGGNQAVIDYTWTRDGEYVARCAVTDMKGGTASASVIVRVGVINTFVVSGRVLKDGVPVEGVLVKAGARLGYTDSDGTYRVTRIPASRPTVSASLERYLVLNSGFENPISLASNVSGFHFAVIPDSLNSITLVATGSVWKYLDTGPAPASDWTALSYDDSAWSTGRAKLGYGVGDEATVIGFGGNPTDRRITTWFRQRFSVDDKTGIQHLVLRLRRDDGAVVYLNGREIYRENLPTGEIQSSTTAKADVGSTEEQTFFRRLIPSAELVNGANLLAVEVHQFRTNSPDLSFDLELVAMTEAPDVFLPSLATQRNSANLQIAWPAQYPGWSLYSSRVLETPADWLRVATPASQSNGLSRVALSPTNASGFFQLQRPSYCNPFQ